MGSCPDTDIDPKFLMSTTTWSKPLLHSFYYFIFKMSHCCKFIEKVSNNC